MREIFISYRRIDTETSGGHLFADLRRAFGDDSVFMDTRARGIAWGAEWDKALDDALNRCDALIALIGPLWVTCERSPGVRRLDAPDDWVRGEIATALRRGIGVLPVLFQHARWPEEEALPQELQMLRFYKRQAYEITEANWEADVQRLVDELVAIPQLKQRHDLATTQTGIRLLEDLIRRRPEVSDAVSRSRAVIETTDREVDEIRLLKGIHAALHEIEAKCLIPMGEVPSTLPVIGFRRKFVQQERVIRTLVSELASVVPDLPALLDIDLPRHLTAAAEALEQAVTHRGPEVHDRAAVELEGLISHIPGRLNDAIDNAATRVELTQLAELLKRVGDLLRPTVAGDTELKPLFDGIAALEGLRDELGRRIHEHGLLQSLDNVLRLTIRGQRRVGTAGRIEASTLVVVWDTVKRLRARFQPPFSPEVEEGHRELEAREPDIEAAVLRGDEPGAVALLTDYYNEVGDWFRRVDSNLKEFCFDLREKTRPLKTILDMCRGGARNG
jgi:hypothetical protein